MTLPDGLLTVAALLLAAVAIYDRRRPRRTTYTSLDAAVDAMTRVAAGLHEDLDSVRQELRNAVGLPRDAAVPALIQQVRLMTILVWAVLILHALLGLSFLWLILDLRGRGVLAALGML